MWTQAEQKALKYLAQGEYEKAIEAYKEILKEGEDPDIYNALGDIHLRINKFDEAVEYYEKALELYEKEGFVENAIAVAKKLQRHGERKDLLLTLAKLYAQLGRNDESIEYLNRYLEKDIEQSDLPILSEIFRKIGEGISKDSEILPRFERLFLKLQELIEKFGEKSLETWGEYPPLYEEQGPDLPEELLGELMQYEETLSTPEEKTAVEEEKEESQIGAEDKIDEIPEDIEEIVQEMLEEEVKKEEEIGIEDIKEEEDKIKEEITVEEETKVEEEIKEEMKEEIEEEVEEGAEEVVEEKEEKEVKEEVGEEVEVPHQEIKLEEGVEYAEETVLEEIGEAPEKAEELPPLSAELLEIVDILKQLKSSLPCVRERVYEPFSTGKILLEMGLLEDALIFFQEAIKNPQMRLEAYEYLGKTFMKKGELEYAIKVLKRGLGEGGYPEHSYCGIYYTLGRAYEEIGNSEEALKAYEEIYLVDANYKDVKTRLKNLRDMKKEGKREI